jgi:hypothetical protein
MYDLRRTDLERQKQEAMLPIDYANKPVCAVARRNWKKLFNSTDMIIDTTELLKY